MAFSDTIAELQKIDGEDFKRVGTAPVSYTHLTLPTIYSV